MSHRTELRTELTGGLLHAWQRRNRAATIPHAIRELRAAGNLDNLRRLADPAVGPYRGRYPFLDTDLYKTVEGLAYEAGRDDVPAGTREFYYEVVGLLEQAQADDGYLNSYFQDPDQPKQPWSDLAWGHELYNLGHLVQAAIAAKRQLGDNRLLIVARRFADLVVTKFGPDGEPGIDGHPEVEMALVELYRETGQQDYLSTAELFVERRGRGNLVRTIFPGEYFQDHVPFREMPSVIGHAVRMAYLAAGATDIHLETGDPTMLAALERLWDDMVATKLYLTGGLGSRHSDEAIGDRYELPSERAYTETCAAIALMQWAWRMYLATGKASYLDVYETVLYNAYAVGLSADGTAFFYDNPLQRRPDHEQRSGAESGGEPLRRAWFGCPCCPPNIIRWMSELQDHLATAAENTLTIGMYADARISTGEFTVTVGTDYPWDGEIAVTVVDAPATEQAIVLRIPSWAQDARLDGEPVPSGWATVRRRFAAGEVVKLSLPMAPRAHGSHPYLDATRGAIAVARGPLVYCVEQQDSATPVDDLLLSVTAVQAATARRQDDHVVLDLTAAAAPVPPRELYPVLTGRAEEPVGSPVPVTFVPYFLWGNREALAMRVWLRSEGEGR
ncbi:glycoside hydrolase family 127 protein [Kribbella yunnanensis]